jgi:NAD(P)H-hydrate epimerase
VDDEIYPILAVSAGGIIVSPQSTADTSDRFRPDALLLGPGWGRGENRLPAFRNALDRERDGLPLILDADAIHLARDTVFHGNAIVTPHVGELAAYAGLPKENVMGSPGPFLTRLARERNVTILFKSHVMFIAGPDGRLGIVDGMTPILGAGGTGDLLGGLCAAIAARQNQMGSFDPYTCAVIAAALLAEVGRIAQQAGTFTDPMDLADIAAGLAGKAWL